MKPKNWWFVIVDVSPFPGNIFRFHVGFRGCKCPRRFAKPHILSFTMFPSSIIFSLRFIMCSSCFQRPSSCFIVISSSSFAMCHHPPSSIKNLTCKTSCWANSTITFPTVAGKKIFYHPKKDHDYPSLPIQEPPCHNTDLGNVVQQIDLATDHNILVAPKPGRSDIPYARRIIKRT